MSEIKKNQSPVEGKPSMTMLDNDEKNKPMDKKINDLIGPIFESLKIEEGIVIAKIPGSDKVSIYYRGHFYDAASLVANVHRKFKNKIVNDID